MNSNHNLYKQWIIGIDTSNFSGMLIKQHKVIGINQSINMLKEAKLKSSGIEGSYRHFLQLQIKIYSVDNIVTSYIFHHYNDREKFMAIKEMDHVLKSDGRIIIACPHFLTSHPLPYNQKNA